MSDDLKPIIEALIFASPEPITPKVLFKLLASEPKEDIEAALASLKADYERPGGLQMVEVAGGYQIVTRPELNEWVRRLFHERTTQKLSVAALETLAVIAYKQPVTQAQVIHFRNSKAYEHIKILKEKGFIRKEKAGITYKLFTTKKFHDYFGKNLAPKQPGQSDEQATAQFAQATGAPVEPAEPVGEAVPERVQPQPPSEPVNQ
ncbi:MAG TPA: SMC-Scp complex subunit ScpB [Candidatus Diapherotrites archaeon]|uniref:SMC-Scp complex subunit ScpB n=1 Tax=Candidatus Iainarchaeum sp. TaxID=3101447 RepID=A0A7J4JGS0_9ARCH|nr:SMC-Scp complex subunit ScpB [Candidatus Diapherotrites archaeon]